LKFARARQLAAVGVVLAAALAAASCGSNNTSGNAQPITLSVVQDPPPTLAVNASAQIAATVQNDPLHRGVQWTCTPVNTCGTFSPASTGNGAATTYTAPSQRGPVVITATALSNSLATQKLNVNITSPISVQLTETPPQSIQSGTVVPVAAVVTGDAANAGVNWSCSPSSTCGFFTPTQTASGVESMYTAPGVAGSVTITATSVTDSTSFATFSFSVFTVLGVSNLSGPYAFYVSGQDKNHHAYSVAGALVLDGMGGVTGGEQDVNNGAGTISPEPGGDLITGGSYTLGIDGQGTLVVRTNNAAVGAGGTETFAIVRVNSKHVAITGFDGGATSSGTLDTQVFFPNVTGQIAGSFSFVLAGSGGGGGLALGGVLAADGGGNLTSVTYDQDVAGVVNFAIQTTGSYTAPDAYGRARAAFGGLNFSLFIVGPETIRVIETDNSRVAVGSAFGQGTLSGAASVSSVSGTYVAAFSSGAAGKKFSAAGTIVPDGRGKISGFADVNEAGSPVATTTYAANYTISSSGYGRISVASGGILDVQTLGLYVTDPQLNLTDPNSPNGVGGFLVADLDANVTGGGLAASQIPTTLAKGNFGVTFQSQPAAGEEDFSGGTSTTLTGSLTGTGSLNQLFGAGQTTGIPATVTLTADPLHARRFTATVQLNGGGAYTFAFYLVNSQVLFGAELDSSQPGLATVQQQQ